MKRIICAVVLVALVAAASGATLARPAGECVDTSLVSSAGAGAFPRQFQIISSTGSLTQPTYTKVSVAQDFEVSYYTSFKVVTNKKVNQTYVLYPCGLPAPSDDEIPAGAKKFAVPLLDVAVSDASVLAFMGMLGVQSRISYTTKYAVAPCMQTLGLYSCGRTTDSLNDTVANQLGAQMGFGYVGMDPIPSNFISVNAAPDPGVLNRAEWIKYVSTFFNKEDEANRIFGAISTAYASTKAAAAAAANPDPSKRPLVAWLYYQPAASYGPAQLQISQPKYLEQYITDAGGRALNMTELRAQYVNGGDIKYQFNALVLYNLSTAGDTLRTLLKDVDIVIDLTRYPVPTPPGQFTTQAIPNSEVTLKTFMDAFKFESADVLTLKFLKSGSVLRVDAASNPDSFTDWLEGAIAQPDLVLRDLTSFITPAANVLPANTATRFLRNLVTAQPSTLYSTRQCPLENCQLPVAAVCPLIYRACNGSVVYATPEARCPPTTCTPVKTDLAAGSAVVAPIVLLAALLLAMAAAMMV